MSEWVGLWAELEVSAAAAGGRRSRCSPSTEWSDWVDPLDGASAGSSRCKKGKRSDARVKQALTELRARKPLTAEQRAADEAVKAIEAREHDKVATSPLGRCGRASLRCSSAPTRAGCGRRSSRWAEPMPFTEVKPKVEAFLKARGL
jgi:hypothetical protein